METKAQTPTSRFVRGEDGRSVRITRVAGVWGWWENGTRTNLEGEQTFWTALDAALEALR